jgi:hypothetical protein
MANKKIYTKSELQAIKEGLNHYFPYETGDVTQPKIIDDRWSDLNGIYKWHDRGGFFITLSEVTGIQKLSFIEIKSASGVLESMERAAPETVEFESAKKESPEANTLSPEKLKEMVAANEGKAEQRRADAEKSNQAIKDVIKKQQEIYADQIQKEKVLKEKLEKEAKLHYEKVEGNKVDETQAVKNLREQAKANSRQFIKDTTEQFKNNPNLKGMSSEEVELAAKQGAVALNDMLTENTDSPIFLEPIVRNMISDPKLLNKVASSPEDQRILNDILLDLTNAKEAQYKIASQFFDPSKINGSLFNIKFSDAQGAGEFDLSQVASQHIDSLNFQSSFLGNLQGLGEGEIKSKILLGVGNQLDSYIAKLPANSLLTQTYNSDLVQLGLSSLGIVEAAPSKTGIDLGIKIAAKEGGKQIAEMGLGAAGEAAVEGGEIVAEEGVGLGIAATVTAALTPFIGPLAPIAGFLANLFVKIVGTQAVNKVINWAKDNAQKYSKYVVAVVGAGLGFVVGGGAGAVVGGLFGYGGASLLSGGISELGSSLTSFGSGILSFFGALGSATLGAIGPPILATLIGLPVVVALILFIINSGAYVVPPGGFGSSSGLPISGTPVNLKCDSLDKTLGSSAYAAELIACALSNAGLNPLFANMVNSSNWQKLTSVLNGAAIAALAQSANVSGSWGGVVSNHLQCVGYVAATAGQAYGQAFRQIDACSYIDNPPAGYKYVSGTNGMTGGDFFVINGTGGCDKSPYFSPGHIGVVISVTGVGVNCADANEVAAGEVRVANGCFVTSQITGYLRKN